MKDGIEVLSCWCRSWIDWNGECTTGWGLDRFFFSLCMRSHRTRVCELVENSQKVIQVHAIFVISGFLPGQWLSTGTRWFFFARGLFIVSLNTREWLRGYKLGHSVDHVLLRAWIRWRHWSVVVLVLVWELGMVSCTPRCILVKPVGSYRFRPVEFEHAGWNRQKGVLII